jgi:hypothetical protein
MLRTSRALSMGSELLLLSTVCAAAQRTGACASDIRTHCGDVPQGGSRIAACIKEHSGDLSIRCKARLARAAVLTRACALDMNEQCAADMGRGRGRTAACLRDALPNLSDRCKAAVSRVVIGRR